MAGNHYKNNDTILGFDKDGFIAVVGFIGIIVGIILLGCLGDLINIAKCGYAKCSNSSSSLPDSGSGSSNRQSNVLTPEKVRAYIGKTTRELCADYSGHNIHFYFHDEDSYIGGSCDDMQYGFPGDYIITDAYYDDDDDYYSVPEEYRPSERRIYVDAWEK